MAIRTRPKFGLFWLGYLCWAVFINAVNVLLLTPLVEDYAILGVVVVFVIAAVWVFGIPVSKRRRWIAFTMFSLLIGQGLATVAIHPSAKEFGLAVIMCLGLVALTWIVGRTPVRHLIIAVLGLVVVTWLLPLSEWPFLTQFSIADSGNLPLSTADFSALPLVPVNHNGAQTVITVRQVAETQKEFVGRASNATASTDQLQNVLSSYNHLYELVALRQTGGKVRLTTPTRAELAAVNPVALDPQFPFTLANWSVVNGKVMESFIPTLTSREVTALGMTSTQLPNATVEMSLRIRAEEMKNWQRLLTKLGVHSAVPGLSVTNGILQGSALGHSIDVKVGAAQVIGTGSFTAPHARQLLVEGLNSLEVISLAGHGRVVSVYHGNQAHPLPSDLVIGPVDNSGRDVVFVNSSPAVILGLSSTGQWRQLYQAPNAWLRFEAAVRLPGDHAPEVIADDISLMQPSATRYLTSYTYTRGNLVRNWRVYRTNIAKVLPVRLAPGSGTDLLATVSGTGKFVVLKRQHIPVVPIASVLLLVIIAGGYALRLREWRHQNRREAE